MKNWQKIVTFVCMVTMMVFLGCRGGSPVKESAGPESEVAPPAAVKATELRCRYNTGLAERVRLTSRTMNKVWVEMPGKESTNPSMNETESEIVLRSEVESVQQDGSAVIKVTIETVKLNLKSDVNDKAKTDKYSSSDKETTSTWSGAPKLAGASYKIKIAPDTTVLEVMGLDELRKTLKIKSDDRGIVPRLISESNIKKYHQHPFIQYSPAKVPEEKGADFALPKKYEKNVILPDAMIKAKAVKKIYQPAQVQQQGDSQIVTISINGEPLYVLPEGVAQPIEPNNFGQTLIKKMSEMQELKITGQGVFDLTAGKTLSDKNDIDCTLILLEEDIGMGDPNKKKGKGSGGVMFTKVERRSSYEVLD